jgi:hypothetical protein
MKFRKICTTLVFLVILATLSLITSCSHDAEIANLPEVCFDRDVFPVFAANCSITDCHGGGGESDLTFRNYDEIRNTVVPYNPDASVSYKAIISTWGENKMPPDQPLTKDNRTAIRLWIEQGAAHSTCPDTPLAGEAKGSTFEAIYSDNK